MSRAYSIRTTETAVAKTRDDVAPVYVRPKEHHETSTSVLAVRQVDLGEFRKQGRDNARATETSYFRSASTLAVRYEDERGTPPKLPADSRVKRLKGVVSEVDNDSIAILVQLGSKEVPMRLSRAVVPEDVTHFATPVWISLDSEGEAKRLVVERRAEINTLELSPAAKKALEWANS